jgi:hypothetical protein
MKKSDVNTKQCGETVLMKASQWGHLDAVSTLLAADDINIKSSVGWIALLEACRFGHIEVVKVLLAAHSLNPTNDFINDTTAHYRKTVLMYACMSGHVEVVKLLLSIPTIIIHLKDRGEKTALDFAQGKANEDEIMALLQGELLPSFTAQGKANEDEIMALLQGELLPSFTHIHSPLLLTLTISHCLSLSALIPSHSVHHALLLCFTLFWTCHSFFSLQISRLQIHEIRSSARKSLMMMEILPVSD